MEYDSMNCHLKEYLVGSSWLVPVSWLVSETLLPQTVTSTIISRVHLLSNIVLFVDSALRSRCPMPHPAGRNMVAHRAGVYVGSSATYVCDRDYEFPEGGSHRTVVCRADGTWSDAVGDCKRT